MSTSNVDKSAIIKKVCDVILERPFDAQQLLKSEYPFGSIERTPKSFTEEEALRVFIRDGFVDRYSGQRLVFPGTLRLLSIKLPDDFPFQKNWKMSLTHEAFWELFPTVDHVKPVARGGQDDQSNWVTTSQLNNSAKSNWTLEELSWSLVERGNFDEWDGLVHWFVQCMDSRPELRTNGYLKTWWRAAKACLNEDPSGQT